MGVLKAAGGLGEPEQTGEGREVGAHPARSPAGDGAVCCSAPHVPPLQN